MTKKKGISPAVEEGLHAVVSGVPEQTEEQYLESRNIHQRIRLVMEQISNIPKDGQVDHKGGKYRYISHDAVTKALHPLLVDYGIVVLPTIESYKQDGNRTEMLVKVAFINVDQPTDGIVMQSLGYGIDNQDKGPAKALSIAVKMAYLKMFCLETGDPDIEESDTEHVQHIQDAQAGQSPEAVPPRNVDTAARFANLEKATAGQIKVLRAKAKAINVDLDEYLQQGFQIKDATQLPADMVGSVKKELTLMDDIPF